MQGNQNKTPSSTLHWPKQRSPDTTTWKIWSKTLTQLYCTKPQSNVFKK